MSTLVGIDSGLTVTKAVVFDADGTPLAVARRKVTQIMPAPHRVERDMDELWRASAEAVAEALAASGRPAQDVACVAATAHGDGVYLLDARRRPLGNAILSLDSRAEAVVAGWAASDLPAAALALTGQVPHVSAPSALLAHVAREEPERFARIAHVLSCKDVLRFRLTDTIGTDRTEASTSFTDVATQDFSRDALELYGLGALWGALPPVSHSAAVVGAVSAEAAAATGLLAGTPVAAGLHDVTASALGVGGQAEGVVGIVAGTYSINEVLSRIPKTDPRWFCRNAIEPGVWNAMAISPASTANYDWFLDTLCRHERDAAGATIHDSIGAEIDAALARPSSVLFHPFLFGSPHGMPSSGSLVGLHGWHDRGDMLKAVLEGIAFNHRTHVDALAAGFPFAEVRLTGGASRSPRFAQMFCDILALPVVVTATEEAAAWGAALCAGAAVGLYPSAGADPRDLAELGRRYLPDPARSATFAARFAVYEGIAEALRPHWAALEGLAS